LSDDTANSPKKVRGRPFPKGKSANPSGRPQGSRNKATIALEKLMADDGEAVVQSVRPIQIDLPPVKSADDVAEAMARLVAQTAQGELTPEEGGALASILEIKRRSIETADLEARVMAEIAALKAQIAAQ
jgi:hypothetical protein